MAASGECLEIQSQEEAIPGRDFEGMHPEGLEALELEGSWLVGILLCPGDGTEAAAAWASKLDPADIDRVRFYFLPDVDLVDAFDAWFAQGLPDPVTAEVDDWGSFHRTFGMDHSNQVYRDVKAHPTWFET